jgi:dinuclear metal center YbgI/SA1388 family protein
MARRGYCFASPRTPKGSCPSGFSGYRGARIRTGDLADPNGARYQAAPRPDAALSIPQPGSGVGATHAPRGRRQGSRRPRSRYGRPMPCQLKDAVAELDRLLEPERFADYCPNGLQVPGRADVRKVVTGVSANLELFERAASWGADLVVVHHGLFWGSSPTAIDLPMKRRLKLLFDADMSLAGYHLPLDAHPEVGNNALLARALGAEALEPFALHGGLPIGFIAHLPAEGLQAETLFARVRELTARTPLVFDAGPTLVRSVAIVTGAGNDHLADAIAAGAHAFLTGEPSERVMSQAHEASIHYIAAGHYATETLGVKRLGEHLGERFATEHLFIDVPNPI